MTDSRGLGCADERRREVTLDELDELIKFVLRKLLSRRVL